MLRGIWARAVLVFVTVLFGGPLTLLLLLFSRRSNLLVAFGRRWSRTMLAATGARMSVTGIENATRHSPCIFIANHQSILDIWVMFTLVPPETRFVAKQELFRVPFLGWSLAASGCIPINRGSRADAIRSLRVAGDRVRAGSSVILFPEGSRSDDGRLGPFKKGAFHLALHAGVPVVPVAIAGSFRIWPKRGLRVKPGPLEVFVEPPIEVGPFQPHGHDRLRARVREAIAQHVTDSRTGADENATPIEAS